MRVGISLSPGGLLLPYHLGVLDGLSHCGYLTDQTAIAGASAGSIAAASHACDLDSKLVLDATIDMSDTTAQMGGARGNLLPLLRTKLEGFVGPEQFERAQSKQLAIAYRELFPRFRSIHQTQFENKEDLISSVCHSSMFPFFSTNWPVTISNNRVLVDGFFAVPRTRFGCPDFDKAAGIDVDKTVMVSCFPKEFVGLTEHELKSCHNVICPQPAEGTASVEQVERLLRLATQSSTASEYIELYDEGYDDAERWYYYERPEWEASWDKQDNDNQDDNNDEDNSIKDNNNNDNGHDELRTVTGSRLILN